MNSRLRPLEGECPVQVRAGDVVLAGSLCIPAQAHSVVLFAHGSGSSRLSPRNRYVAGVLQNQGLATLLFDLLTADEEAEDVRTGRLRFDINLLAKRLAQATDWVMQNPDTRDFDIGYFGASTGAAAALVAAAERSDVVHAIVSRGGRPDLAGNALPDVKAPTLLIVGGDDTLVIRLNKEALARLTTEKELVIVPGATHLFEEPGTLEKVAQLAADWFEKHLGNDPPPAGIETKSPIRRRFRLIPHTADIGLVAYGQSLPEAYANAAYGLFSIIAELRGVREAESRIVEVSEETPESLLFEWLNRLLYIFDVEHLLFNRFEIKHFDSQHLEAVCYGEKFDPMHHHLKLGVKSATYHTLKVDPDKNQVRVIFDV